MSESRNRPPIQQGHTVQVKMEPRHMNGEHITKHGVHRLLSNGSILSTSETAINVLNGHEGKRRKYIIQKSSQHENNNTLHQQWNSTTTDGSVVFKILNQPEIQHRARYQTEGSRGAIKDRSGTGYPTVQIDGYRKATKIQIFIGNDNGKVIPHMFYQVCRVTGKNSNPCEERKIDGTDILEIPFEPHNDMTIICDCVGILKERFADVEARFPKHKTWRNAKKKSTKCRLVFRTVVENRKGELETLQVVSDVINCTQLPGTPEILKTSVISAQVDGGGELWIIGKNFLKDTRVIFSYSVPGKREPLWTKFIEPEQEYFHQTHLIVTIPPFYDQDSQEDIEISLFIKCGEKLSDPTTFIYTPNPIKINFTPNVSHENAISLPRGVAAPAVAINQQFAKTGSVSVISGTCEIQNEPQVTTPQPRPTILEPLHDHKNKKSRIDYSGRQVRRTRSVPRPNLISEEAVFFTVAKPNPVDKILYTSFSQSPKSPWKGVQKANETTHSVTLSAATPKQCILESPPPLNPLFYKTENKPVFCASTKRTYSNDEDSNSCNFSRDSLQDETSINPNMPDLPSSLTTDFSNAFSVNRAPLSCDTGTTQPFTNLYIKRSADTSPQTSPLASQQNNIHASDTMPWKEEKSVDIPVNTHEHNFAQFQKVNENNVEDKSEVPNVSLTATHEDKATISISLPTSILKNQEHFKNVIETINNTLLKTTSITEKEPNTNNTEENKSQGQEITQSSSQLFNQTMNSEWTQPSPPISGTNSRTGSPKHHITSMPVSVLTANTRKRNFSSEPIGESNYVGLSANGEHLQLHANQPFGGEPIMTETIIGHQQGGLDDIENIGINQATINNSTVTLESSNIHGSPVNSTENPVTYQQTYIKPSNKAIQSPTTQISETYEQWTNSEPTIQEKKWNAEFNEVLQTVFEETKENPKEQMEWVQDSSNKMVIPDSVEKETMEWNTESIIKTSDMNSGNILKDNAMEWTSNANKMEKPIENTQTTLEPPINMSYLVPSSTTNALNQEILNNLKPIPVSSTPTQVDMNQSNDGKVTQIYQDNVSTSQEASTSVSQQISLPDLSKTSVEFLSDNRTMENVQQQFDQFTSAVVTMNPIPSFSADTNTGFPATTSSIKNQDKEAKTVNYEQNPTSNLGIFDETSVQIQGDPLLSETSSVISAQKDIECVTFSDVVYESEIPQDQQWATQSTTEWNYNSTS